MKVINKIFVLLFVLSLINVSCKNNVEGLLVEKETDKAYLKVACNSKTRTVQPNYNLESLTDFELFQGENKIAGACSYKELSELVIEVGYVAGEQSISRGYTLKAKYKETVLVAYSFVTLHSGINTIGFDLSPSKVPGNGIVDIVFNINKSLGVKGIKAGLYSVEKDESIEGFASEKLEVQTDDKITAKYTKELVPNGYYLFKADFYADLDCKIFINNYESIVEVITGSTANSVIEISELNKIYSIQYVLNGGEFIDGFSITNMFTRLSNLELPTYVAVKKDGAFFAGWYLDEDFSGDRLENITSLEDDIIVYAKWNSNIELTPENLSAKDLSNVNDIQKIIVSGDFSNNLNELSEKIKSITSTSAEIILDMSNITGVTEISEGLFKNYNMLKTVVIPDSVTNIEKSAFENCSIETFVIHDGVKTIGDNAFKNCTVLKYVTIGKGLEEVGSGAFTECPLLESVYYKGTLTDWVKIQFKTRYEYEYPNIYNAISGNPCSAGAVLYINSEQVTDEIRIPDGVERIGQGSFFGFRQLTSVTIPKSVTEIGESAFGNCFCIKSVYYDGTVSDWVKIKFDDNPFVKSVYHFDTNSDLYIRGEKLTEIKENDFSPDVTKIANSAFSGCASLTSVVIGNGIETIGDSAFSVCKSLKNVVIKDGVVEIGDSAFYSCNALKSIEIPASVRDIYSEAFKYCNIDSVYYNGTLSDWMKINFSDSYNTFWSGDKSYDSNPCRNGSDLYISSEKLTEIKEGDISDGITEILPGCFYGVKLDSVVIGNNIKSIGNCAFRNTNIEELSIGDNVVLGDYVFAGASPDLDIVFTGTIEQWCARKWYLDIEYNLYINEQKVTNLLNFDTLTDIGNHVFSYCKSLTDITIPDGITVIGNESFSHCDNLINLTISKGVESIGQCAFEGCKNLENVTILNSNIKISLYPFIDCPKLSRIDCKGSLFQWVYRVKKIGVSDFSMVIYLNDVKLADCNELIIPEGETATGEFSNLSFINSVKIPDSVKSISANAFEACTGLTSIIIPANVTFIGEKAFCDCTGLTSITFVDPDNWYMVVDVVNGKEKLEPVDVNDVANVNNLVKIGKPFIKITN